MRKPTYLVHIFIEIEFGADPSLGGGRVETGSAGVVGLGLGLRPPLHLLPLHRFLHLFLPFLLTHFFRPLPFGLFFFAAFVGFGTTRMGGSKNRRTLSTVVTFRSN